MEITKKGDKINISAEIDIQDFLYKIPLRIIMDFLKDSRANYNDASHEGIKNFIESNIDYLKEESLRMRTRLAIKSIFWEDLKQNSDIAFFEFYIRKKDVYNFHQEQVSFFNKPISFEDSRYENLIRCKFPDGKGKFYQPLIYIKDVIRIHKSYSSPECLVEFGQLLTERGITAYTYDEIQSADWQAEAIKEDNERKLILKN